MTTRKLKLAILSALLLALCSTMTINAQTTSKDSIQRVRHFEYETRAGATRPLGSSIPETDRMIGICIGGEFRYNFTGSPFDVGLALDITTALYGWHPDEYDREQSNRTVFLGAMVDYNFHQGGKVNPFVGFGIGYGGHNALIDKMDDKNDGCATAMVVPRVGVELWRHLRFTLAANLSCKYYNNLSLTVGYVIGGGKKK